MVRLAEEYYYGRYNCHQDEKMMVKPLQQICEFKGWFVAYPVMQAHGSIAWEDNSEVGKAVLGRYSTSCVCYLPAKEAGPQQLVMGDLVISPACKVVQLRRAWNDPGIPLRGSWKIGLTWKTSTRGPVDVVPFHGHSHRGQPLKIHTDLWAKDLPKLRSNCFLWSKTLFLLL